MSLVWWLFGIVAILAFFNGAPSTIRKWENLSETRFIKKLFWTAFTIRAIYVVVMYFFYIAFTGQPFEFEAADVGFYHAIGQFGADCLWDGKFNLPTQIWTQDPGIDISDMGYPVYLSIIYAITGKSILIARIFKAAFSA